MMSPAQKRITATDIMPMADYGRMRREHRRKLVEVKKKRRVHIGPHVSLYFENYDTMWAQVHEMLFIERGGAAQVEGELAAYNPLIPQGAELIATLMIEIEEPAAHGAADEARRHRGECLPHRRFLAYRRDADRIRGPHVGGRQDLVGAFPSFRTRARDAHGIEVGRRARDGR